MPLVERLQPIVFEFGVTWFPGNINMAVEELEAAEFDWSFDNSSQLINLNKDLKNHDMRDKALVEIASKLGTTSE